METDLNDEEELEHEGHVDVRVSLPELADAQQVLAPDDVAGPQETEKVTKIH